MTRKMDGDDMTTKHDGGPAFPHESINPYNGSTVYGSGMSLRDWFAGKALASISIEMGVSVPFEEIAAETYRMADAMLAERQKP
jgi:hypothetical protein